MNRRTFRILPAEITPTGALTWAAASDRRAVLRRWRRMVFRNHGKSVRDIRVAWALADLFNTKTGFAHAGDKYLAKETGLSVRQVEKALQAFDRRKLIVRVHRIIDGRPRRHIYPAGQPSAAEGSNRPQWTLRSGGTDIERQKYTTLLRRRQRPSRRSETSGDVKG